MRKSNLIKIIQVDVVVYVNEYTERLTNILSRGKIQINELTCVYKKWPTTLYSFTTQSE